MLSTMMTAATTRLTQRSRTPSRQRPMTCSEPVRRMSGTMAKGMPKESTTWLTTNAQVGSDPRAMMTSAGMRVMTLWTMIGTRTSSIPA